MARRAAREGAQPARDPHTLKGITAGGRASRRRALPIFGWPAVRSVPKEGRRVHNGGRSAAGKEAARKKEEGKRRRAEAVKKNAAM